MAGELSFRKMSLVVSLVLLCITLYGCVRVQVLPNVTATSTTVLEQIVPATPGKQPGVTSTMPASTITSAYTPILATFIPTSTLSNNQSFIKTNVRVNTPCFFAPSERFSTEKVISPEDTIFVQGRVAAENWALIRRVDSLVCWVPADALAIDLDKENPPVIVMPPEPTIVFVPTLWLTKTPLVADKGTEDKNAKPAVEHQDPEPPAA